MRPAAILIRAFEAGDASAVADLNRAWLDRFGIREPIDDRFLADPARSSRTTMPSSKSSNWPSPLRPRAAASAAS